MVNGTLNINSNKLEDCQKIRVVRGKINIGGPKAGNFFWKVGEELIDFWGHPGRITYSVVEYIPLQFFESIFYLSQVQYIFSFCFAIGPFKYYVIKILTFLDHTHPVCNQTLLIKHTLFSNLAYPTHSHPLDYEIFPGIIPIDMMTVKPQSSKINRSSCITFNITFCLFFSLLVLKKLFRLI